MLSHVYGIVADQIHDPMELGGWPKEASNLSIAQSAFINPFYQCVISELGNQAKIMMIPLQLQEDLLSLLNGQTVMFAKVMYPGLVVQGHDDEVVEQVCRLDQLIKHVSLAPQFTRYPVNCILT